MFVAIAATFLGLGLRLALSQGENSNLAETTTELDIPKHATGGRSGTYRALFQFIPRAEQEPIPLRGSR